MKINWKIIGIFAGIGFFISFLSGIIGGVKFGTIFLRGIIGAVIFGGIGFGLVFIVKKFLPGLSSDEPEDSEDEQPGIDIVIEEENPLEAPGLGLEVETAEALEGESFVEEVEETSGEELRPMEAAADFNSAEESAELLDVDDAEDVDALPDISEFSGAFSTGTELDDSGEGGSSEDAQMSSGGESTIDVLGSEESPADIAKAVQTMLKRD